MLHFHEHGDAAHPTILFLHGFMGAGADWRATIATLQHEYRCLAVDLPGHGASVGMPDAAYTMEGAAQTLLDLLDHLGIDRCAVVGYSMGGRLALYVALHHAGRCARLVLESASPGLATEVERAARRTADEARARRLEAGDLQPFLNEWYRQPLFASMEEHAGLVERMVQARLRNDPRELARSLRGMGTGRQPSLWERLSALRVSTLAVAGGLDRKFVEIAERMARLSPEVQPTVVQDAGHTVHAERPHRFLGLLRAFLDNRGNEEYRIPNAE